MTNFNIPFWSRKMNKIYWDKVNPLNLYCSIIYTIYELLLTYKVLSLKEQIFLSVIFHITLAQCRHAIFAFKWSRETLLLGFLFSYPFPDCAKFYERPNHSYLLKLHLYNNNNNDNYYHYYYYYSSIIGIKIATKIHSSKYPVELTYFLILVYTYPSGSGTSRPGLFIISTMSIGF